MRAVPLALFAGFLGASGTAGTSVVITADVLCGIMIGTVIGTILGEGRGFGEGHGECRKAKCRSTTEGEESDFHAARISPALHEW